MATYWLQIVSAVDDTHICKQPFPFLQEQTHDKDTVYGAPATVKDGEQQKKKQKVAPVVAKPVAAAADGGHSSDDEV